MALDGCILRSKGIHLHCSGHLKSRLGGVNRPANDSPLKISIPQAMTVEMAETTLRTAGLLAIKKRPGTVKCRAFPPQMSQHFYRRSYNVAVVVRNVVVCLRCSLTVLHP
jgi:hypothetical protein